VLEFCCVSKRAMGRGAIIPPILSAAPPKVLMTDVLVEAVDAAGLGRVIKIPVAL
jgi:hypothetical protein